MHHVDFMQTPWEPGETFKKELHGICVSAREEGGSILLAESEKKGHRQAFTDSPLWGGFQRFVSLKSSLFSEGANDGNSVWQFP